MSEAKQHRLTGMVSAPHHLAAHAGREVLREGGSAIEAAIAVAACLSVVYPHMTGLGGDGFWLIHRPGRPPVAIDACGRTGNVSAGFYRAHELTGIPYRGALAANTVAGTVAGWQAAYALNREGLSRPLPLARLFRDAVHYARTGYAVTASQAANTADKLNELAAVPGFADVYLSRGAAPRVRSMLRNAALADTLEQLARTGLEDFYRGALAEAIAEDLARAGSPLTLADLQAHRAELKSPLHLAHRCGVLYNTTWPTQGIASLMILGLFDRLRNGRVACDSAEHVHLLVEATKTAFARRAQIADAGPEVDGTLQGMLGDATLDAAARRISPDRAAPWGAAGEVGDTTWFGVSDQHGCVVSCIQSLYHEFGSGVVLLRTGICWQNRGASFVLDDNSPRALGPYRKPFHTLNPALAVLNDGRVMAYGTMGGDGQPQTQAAIFSRYAIYGRELQEAVAAPRWLLGRTWGKNSDTLKIEPRFAPGVLAGLAARGHPLEVVAPFDPIMGHAGAVVRHRSGSVEGASDPRSDGAALGV